MLVKMQKSMMKLNNLSLQVIQLVLLESIQMFLKWNKRSFSKYEMKKLLEDEQVIVRLHGRSGTNEYFKYVITDKEYGVSILWDEEVTKAQDEL